MNLKEQEEYNMEIIREAENMGLIEKGKVEKYLFWRDNKWKIMSIVALLITIICFLIKIL